MSELIDVRDLIGKPFMPRGRGPDDFDCWGLAMEVARRRGVEMAEFEAYDAAMDATVLTMLVNESKRFAIELIRPEPYCLVTLRMVPGYETHIGTVLPDLRRFIHIRRRHRVIISRLNDLFWRPRIGGFYRWVA